MIACQDCPRCVEGIRFSGPDPFNPIVSFCECHEGAELASRDAELMGEI